MLEHLGERQVEEMELSICDYDPEKLEFERNVSVARCLEVQHRENPTWVSASGLHDVEKIGDLLRGFDVPLLLQADTLDTFQRPKIEFLEGSVFLVLRALELVDEGARVKDQQLSMIVTPNAVVTLLEHPTEMFEPLITRLQDPTGRLRRRGVGYLAWAILDVVVDHYFDVIHRLEEAAEKLEEQIEARTKLVATTDLSALRKQAESLYRELRPVSELVKSLRDHLPPPFTTKTHPYLSDLVDHSQYATEIANRLIELANSLKDQNLSEVNTRMNETMRVLTAVATIFMPLTFIAGIYGMNFPNMPEFGISWFYPVLWLVFIGLGAALTLWFRKRKWL
jgi:magnesium transporter